MITSFVNWFKPATTPAPSVPPPPSRPRPQPRPRPLLQPQPQPVRRLATATTARRVSAPVKPCWRPTVVNFNTIGNDNEPNLIRLENCGCRSFKVPLRFCPGNRYAVTVRGLKRGNLPFGVKEFHSVMCRSSVEGRAGPVLSIEDVGKLREAAINYVHEKGAQSTECLWLHRTKCKQYFDRIINENNGKMSPHLKDASGDLRSPINGEICGLFFAANAQVDGQPFANSPFGDTRLLVEVRELLRITTNVYFADFYCLLDGGPHYVILVLTRPESVADRFCRQHLPLLSFEEPSTNPFLFMQHCRIYVTNFTCHVEVFYTEEIQDITEHQIVDNVGLIKSGSSKQGGLPKTRGCRICNLFHGLPLMIDQCPPDYEKF